MTLVYSALLHNVLLALYIIICTVQYNYTYLIQFVQGSRRFTILIRSVHTFTLHHLLLPHPYLNWMPHQIIYWTMGFPHRCFNCFPFKGPLPWDILIL